MFVEFVYIQKLAERVLSFMQSAFDDVKVVESYQSFYRFKIENDVELSQLFGAMERNVRSELTFRNMI